MTLRRVAELDEQRAEHGFKQREDYGGDGCWPRQVSANRAGVSPCEQGDDRDERDAAGDAMGELDHGVYARRVLQHSAVAQRPMGAAACAGAGGADQRAPQNDGDEIDQHAPGEAAQGSRWLAFGIDGDCEGGHEG